MKTITHLVPHDSGNWDKPFTIVTARCGQQGLINDDATVTPLDFDFVIDDDPLDLVDCLKCLATVTPQLSKELETTDS